MAGPSMICAALRPVLDLVDDRPRIEAFGIKPLLKDLREFFNSSDVGIMGVWGQGGVGKTTLLNTLNNELKEWGGDYQVVIMIEVSNSGILNVEAIQRMITDSLGLSWDEMEGEQTRARFLVHALESKKFIILLDDVRKQFLLEYVGIPTPDSESKSKLILTSRYEHVCYQMGAYQSLIKMEYLKMESAWELFRSNLSTDAVAAIESPAHNNVVRQHAEAIVQSCGGLPLALKVIGRAVAGLTEPSDWSLAVQATKDDIKDFNGVPEMFHKLKYSYDKLTETQQKCFLYCTMFPEYGSISKDKLVDCWMAVGLIPRDPELGHHIIRSLLSAYLLENCKSDISEVKMHHIIRYPGISIAGQENARHKHLRGLKFMPSLSPGGVTKTTILNTFNNELKEWCSSYQMDHDVNTKSKSLDRMLLDESAEPTDLPLSLLEDITNCFSDDRQIGIGGFAVVYKGMVGNGMVAVKKLSNTFDMHEKKFHKEVECLMKAKHKNIVRFLGYCSNTQGIIADYEGKFVMADVRNWLLCFEYVPNGSLDKHITDASRGLAWKKRFQIIKGVCDGLCHLHEKRILHLDLKPANILVDAQMVPKIADFGISRFLDAEQTRVCPTNPCGSIGYLAPEFYQGQTSVSFTSDIYSLGVIILEMLTGKKGYSEVENVIGSWMNRLEASSEREMQLKQVSVCTTIGIKCMDSDSKNRPDMRNIVDMLDKVAGLDYLDDTDIHSSSDDLHASFPSEQYREINGRFAVEVLDKANKLIEDGNMLKKFGFKPQLTILEEIDKENKLIEGDGNRFNKFRLKPQPTIVHPLPQIKTFGLKTMLSQLHSLFEKYDSNIIGVWGQGGIGKTTLLHIFNNSLDEKNHDYQVVIFIEVSNSETLNTVEIQQTISERLNLPWNEAEPVAKRAKFLIKALARKRFVVLLDDVRKKFQLEDVGIPTPSTNSLSKLIITSRYREVCFQMNAHRSLIEMQILDEDASWELFLSKLSKEATTAIDSKNLIRKKKIDSKNLIRQQAMSIAKSCGGLPLALNVIGTALASLEEREWKSAADAIATNMDNIYGVHEMFGRLKYSFDMLTPTQQECFLYCTMFPEYGSISKEQLVDYWLAEGFLFKDRKKGYLIIRSLISACLLQATGSLSSKVKMHQIIRHLGLWLVNKSGTKFLVQPGLALDNAPSAGEWKGATRISIMSNNITELSFSPNCKNVTTLLIQNNPSLNKMSYGFFRTMSSLKVLDLSHTAITSLPECDALVALEHLNLSHTHIMRLPERLWLLKELWHLDLSVTDALEDTLNNCSKLHKLRVLNLFRSHYGIRDVVDLNLDSLKELLFLGITIYAEDVLKKLNMTRPLAKSTHRLNLKYCGEMQSIKISDLNHMEHLEELYVESCYDLITVVADAELTTSHLQFLILSVLPSLENVLVAPMPHNFQYIRKLIISQCPKLLNITWVRRLQLLERLVISHCDEMIQIVAHKGYEEQYGAGAQMEMQDHVSDKQEDHAMVETSRNEWYYAGYSDFPKLRMIVLTELKNLRSICKPRTLPCLETLRVEDCPNLRSIPLRSMHKYGKLKQICGSVDWWNKLQWKNGVEQERLESKYFIPI